MKYETASFKEVDAKKASGLSERAACNEVRQDDKYFYKCYRKWAIAGKPEVWPLPKKPERKAVARINHKAFDELLQNFDKESSKKTIEKLVYISIITSLKRPTVKACDIKIAVEFLQLVHPDYQDNASAENNVQLYIDGMRDLLKETGHNEEALKL